MKTLNLFRAALTAIVRNKMRSFLTMLGIIIGVASVVALVSLGAGAQSDIESQINSMGTNMVIIMPGSSDFGGIRGGRGTVKTLKLKDVDYLREEASNLTHVSAMIRLQEQVVAGNTNWNTSVSGVDPEYLSIRNWEVSAGRGFDRREVAARAKVAVLGQTVVEELFGNADPQGSRIRIRTVPFTVIGVLSSKGQNAMGQDEDDLILVPSTTALYRLSDGESIDAIMASSVSEEAIAEAEDEIGEILRVSHRLADGEDDDFSIRNQSELVSMATSVTGTLTILLAAVAGVSLLVGGIGIMNIMLVSVTERTREIGIRMALGARGIDILFQFLVEATVLSLLGGILGLLGGLGGAYLLGSAMDTSVLPNIFFMVAAVFFTSLVGIFFGFYPARKAANLNPIEALRYE
ncbi:MAG: ABC transporter permease [Proteobacteria bacterium]|nr:ABC transporter permease [Pseudomonadota bacterium]